MSSLKNSVIVHKNTRPHVKTVTKPVSKKKTRRGKRPNMKAKLENIKILGNNISSLNGKKNSFYLVIDELKPSCVMLQETKLYRKGQVKIDNYDIFETIRSYNEGGGLLTAIHKKFNPVHIPISSSSKLSENILVIEADFCGRRVRYINVYGLQENSAISDKAEFLAILDEIIQCTLDQGHYCCIQMDGNAKFGNEVIKGDPYDMSNNGKLLFDLIKELKEVL